MANETNPAVLSAPHDNSESEEPDNVIKSFVEKWNREEYKKYASLAEGARKLFYQKFCEKPTSHFPISPVKCIIQARAKSSETIEQSIRRREKDRTSPDFEGPERLAHSQQPKRSDRPCRTSLESESFWSSRTTRTK